MVWQWLMYYSISEYGYLVKSQVDDVDFFLVEDGCINLQYEFSVIFEVFYFVVFDLDQYVICCYFFRWKFFSV